MSDPLANCRSSKDNIPTLPKTSYVSHAPITTESNNPQPATLGGGLQAFRIGEAVSDDKLSSKVSVYIDQSYMGYQYVIRPTVDFATQFEYYTTIGKVQSSIDAYVAEILTRGYQWVSEDEDSPDEDGIAKMEEWGKKYNVKGLLEYIARDLMICGNNLLGVSDWKPVQMDHIVGAKLKTDGSGEVEDYVFLYNGRWESLPQKPDQYMHNRFIDINRMPWSIGLFHALTTSFKWNNHDATPALELYRRHIQNVGVVEDKYAFQRVLYAFDGSTTSQPELDKLKEQLKGIKPGERWMTTKVPTLIPETIDAAKNGLLDITNNIQNEEITAGLQSSVNRLRTQPSAMADAKESNTKDDAMLLYIFSKLEDIFTQIASLVLGRDGIRFEFGQQDDIELNFANLLQLATVQIGGKPALSPQEFRAIIAQKGVPLDDEMYEEFLEDQDAEKQQQMQQQGFGNPGDGEPTKQLTASATGDDSDEEDDDVKELRKEAYRKLIKKLDEK